MTVSMDKRLFYDERDPDYIFTEDALASELAIKQIDYPDEYKNMSLDEYIKICLTTNNGTLVEVK